MILVSGDLDITPDLRKQPKRPSDAGDLALRAGRTPGGHPSTTRALYQQARVTAGVPTAPATPRDAAVMPQGPEQPGGLERNLSTLQAVSWRTAPCAAP